MIAVPSFFAEYQALVDAELVRLLAADRVRELSAFVARRSW